MEETISTEIYVDDGKGAWRRQASRKKAQKLILRKTLGKTLCGLSPRAATDRRLMEYDSDCVSRRGVSSLQPQLGGQASTVDLAGAVSARRTVNNGRNETVQMNNRLSLERPFLEPYLRMLISDMVFQKQRIRSRNVLTIQIRA